MKNRRFIMLKKCGLFFMLVCFSNIIRTSEMISGDKLSGASWSVTPQISGINITPKKIVLQYLETASVLDVKKEVYNVFKSLYPDNSIIKDRLYNIAIKLSRKDRPILLPENEKMPNVDAIKDRDVSYSLELTKSELKAKYTASEITMTYYNPPCISIDGIPVFENLYLSLSATNQGITIGCSSTQNTDPVFITMPPTGKVYATPFITFFNNALMYKYPQPTAFFKQALAVWAYVKHAKMTFQCMPLQGSVSEGGVTINIPASSASPVSAHQLTSKIPAGGIPPKSLWQKIKSYFQQTWSPAKNYILGLLGIGVVGGAAYYASRNQPAGWFSTWLKPSPQSKPAVFAPKN